MKEDFEANSLEPQLLATMSEFVDVVAEMWWPPLASIDLGGAVGGAMKQVNMYDFKAQLKRAIEAITHPDNGFSRHVTGAETQDAIVTGHTWLDARRKDISKLHQYLRCVEIACCLL